MAYIPSFISMRATVTKFEEKCLRLFEHVVVIETCSCHGNDVILFLLYAFYLW